MELEATRSIASERNQTVLAVYLSGLLQGIALIIFPAAGPLFTDPEFHGLSSGQFGVLFTPQIIAAIAASALSARLAAQFGLKRVLLAGLAADVVAMLLLATSHLFIGAGSLAFVLLLLATGAVGAGFGFTLSALNTYAFDLFPDRADAAVTGLHVLTGMGQVGASLVLNLFLGLGMWWGAPLSVGIALALMLAFQLRLSMALALVEEVKSQAATGMRRLPGRIWLYALAVFLYGASEATFGSWSPIYLAQDAGLAIMEAGLALSVFWGMVTIGRVLFTLIAARLKPRALYGMSPFVVVGVFLALPSLSGFVPNMAGLGLAGLALSFFFPYSVSLASAEEPELAPAVSGTLVAAIMLGTGVTANVVGLVREAVGLSMVFRLSSVHALLMAAVAVYLVLTRVSADKQRING